MYGYDGLKRPRHYAAEIIAIKTREERRAALAKVPEHLRDWVEFYVKDSFEKTRNIKR